MTNSIEKITHARDRPIETIEKIEFIVMNFCSIHEQTPFYLSIALELPISTIYAILANLSLRKLIYKRNINRNIYYTSYITVEEIQKGLEKWPEILKIYPEINEFYLKKSENIKKNAENDVKKLENSVKINVTEE